MLGVLLILPSEGLHDLHQESELDLHTVYTDAYLLSEPLYSFQLPASDEASQA